MKFFNRREALAHGNRVCLGIFPDAKQNAVGFVKVEHDPNGKPDFSVLSWRYEGKLGEDIISRVHEALRYVQHLGAKSVVVMYDPWGGESTILRLTASAEWSSFIVSTVQVPMTRGRIRGAGEIVDEATSAGRLAGVAGDDNAEALTIAAAIEPIEAPPRWAKWGRRSTPFVLMLPTPIAVELLLGDSVSALRGIAVWAVAFYPAYLAGLLIERGWNR